MEKKDKELGVKIEWKDSAAWMALLTAVYLAVLPMADTIALRNLVLAGLLLCVALRFGEIRQSAHVGLIVLLWAGYLLVFPLIATDHQTAWISLGGQWGRGLMAMAAGAGAAVLLSGRFAGSVFFIGLVSAVPLLVHMGLFAVRAMDTGAIPWGYWGRETHHADLGYAAGHVVVLMAVAMMVGERRVRPWAMGLLLLSFLSIVLAQSRAGLVFALFGVALVFAMLYLKHASHIKRHVLALLAVLVVAVAGLAGLAFKEDARWHTLTAKLATGLLGNAIQIECEGTGSIEAQVLATQGPGAPALIDAVRDGDGARVVLLRAGLELALKHPMGSDGSRQAFKKLLTQECAQPAIVMAHAHNGWLDTLLAIGWAGAALYLGVLLQFGLRGYQRFRRDGVDSPWSLVLFTLAIFWMIRGFTDSVFRDHMLEMQGFVLTYAFVVSGKYTK